MSNSGEVFDAGVIVIVITIKIVIARITISKQSTKEFARNNGTNTNMDNFKSYLWNNFPL